MEQIDKLQYRWIARVSAKNHFAHKWEVKIIRKHNKLRTLYEVPKTKSYYNHRHKQCCENIWKKTAMKSWQTWIKKN